METAKMFEILMPIGLIWLVFWFMVAGKVFDPFWRRKKASTAMLIGFIGSCVAFWTGLFLSVP